VSAVIAQRLARKLCEHCKQPYTPTADELAKIGLPESITQLYRPGGCSQCSRGYRGRIAIFQMLVMTDEVRRLTAKESSGQEIEAAAAAAGMRSLWDDGLDKLKNGMTTVDELRRILI
jgi:type II secretory ATPase GspE/PulE/Tfp pilus assembly ATPase PilB-like protein